MKIMVFAPHPDDDIIGCGGSIAKHTAQGHEVSIVFLTSGESGSGDNSKLDLRKIREKEATEGANILGVKDCLFLHLIDGEISTDRESVQKVADIIHHKKPNVIYIPHKRDNHKDHKAAYSLALEAILTAEGREKNWKVFYILAYEVWTPLEKVSYIEDISQFIDMKMKALQKHKTQVDNLRFDDAIKGLNRYRGLMKGNTDYSECFQVVRINNLFGNILE